MKLCGLFWIVFALAFSLGQESGPRDSFIRILDEPVAPTGDSGLPGTVPGLPTQTAAVSALLRLMKPQIPRVAFPKRVRVSQGVAQKILIKKVNPTYPSEARRNGVSGKVIIGVIIGKDGSVTQIEDTEGPSELIPAAVEAVRHWKYKPFTLNGEPVEVETHLVIEFTLSGLQ